MKLARRLFARAVETPGGLKIETIHAFCERLLHLVPFEANVPARFAVLDESQTAELVAEATAHVLAEAATGDDAALAAALGTVSIEAAGDALASGHRLRHGGKRLSRQARRPSPPLFGSSAAASLSTTA